MQKEFLTLSSVVNWYTVDRQYFLVLLLAWPPGPGPQWAYIDGKQSRDAILSGSMSRRVALILEIRLIRTIRRLKLLSVEPQMHICYRQCDGPVSDRLVCRRPVSDRTKALSTAEPATISAAYKRWQHKPTSETPPAARLQRND
eukprot:3332620-Pleurochrysis_carterae.AAC.2